MVKVSPSILSADFSNLAEVIRDLTQAGVELVHLDVMDGAFVPNLTFGPKLIQDLRPLTSMTFDVHLMVEQPERYLEEFAAAGADIITVHYEATKHPHRALQMIKKLGKRAGISLVPSTPPECVDYLLELTDLILVMSVNPGFGGQTFIANQLSKIAQLRQKIDQQPREILLEVDGGINDQTAAKVCQSGADILVAGSYIFTKDYGQQTDKVGFIRQKVANLTQYS